jgi:hypothetical protein
VSQQFPFQEGKKPRQHRASVAFCRKAGNLGFAVSPQAEERKNHTNDYDQAYEIDNAVHVHILQM